MTQWTLYLTNTPTHETEIKQSLRFCFTHLLHEELLAHGHALAEPLLVALQHLLLLIHLPPQVAVCLR